MRGRKPKSVEERAREGNSGHRPLPDVILVGGRPMPQELAEPPAMLGNDGREWWRETVPMLAEAGIIDKIDRFELIQLASHWDDWMKARRVIAQDGHFTYGSVGQLKEHPALKIAREASTAIRQFGEAFGFNPMGRTRLGMAQLEGAAKMAELDKALGDDRGDYIDGAVVPGGDVGLPGI